MPKPLRTLAIALCLHAAVAPALARDISTRTWIDGHGVRWTETVEAWSDEQPGIGAGIDEDDPGATRDWPAAEAGDGGDRLVASSPAAAGRNDAVQPGTRFLAKFGPFVVLDPARALLARETDTDAPRQFARMLAAYPRIRVLELRDCPGTVDDNANLVLGRMIHQRGLETVVPPGGSVRSGAVDLFLAGVQRTAAADSEFAVHAWLDDDGMRPGSFAPSSPVNRKYVVFYHEAGGMPLATASAFYALTNSVPNEQALWLTPRDLARYARIAVR
ncbi:hypothetical protein [Novosphingobium huizhouense]|uniref:hypothetical protein n=1 Tax=Novosphingobium huizhouense TaxID=2866625 RepID=UPI001CD896E4|nr:hypothetical protein [Novosphingobium huizhouense]